MANDKREQAVDKAVTTLHRWKNMLSSDVLEAVNVLIDALRNTAAATTEAQADGWVAIETVDDLPKVGGRYLWQFRNVDDGIEFDLRIFKPSMDGQDFVKVFVAWMPIPTYQRPTVEGKSEGDSNER